MRIILFGGSFDPVHNGHVRVSHSAKQQLQAEDVFLIPARRSPHKNQVPFASGTDRLEMLKLAVSELEDFKVSDCELFREEPSFTIDTINYFLSKFGKNSQLYWLIGADQVDDLDKWYRIEELIDKSHICIMKRGGVGDIDFGKLEMSLGKVRSDKLRSDMLDTPEIEVSSTVIRDKIKNKESIEGLVSSEVANYIYSKGLYR